MHNPSWHVGFCHAQYGQGIERQKNICSRCVGINQTFNSKFYRVFAQEEFVAKSGGVIASSHLDMSRKTWSIRLIDGQCKDKRNSFSSICIRRVFTRIQISTKNASMHIMSAWRHYHTIFMPQANLFVTSLSLSAQNYFIIFEIWLS